MKDKKTVKSIEIDPVYKGLRCSIHYDNGESKTVETTERVTASLIEGKLCLMAASEKVTVSFTGRARLTGQEQQALINGEKISKRQGVKVKTESVSPREITAITGKEPPLDKHEKARLKKKLKIENEKIFSKERQKLRKEFIRLKEEFPDDFEEVFKEYYQQPRLFSSDNLLKPKEGAKETRPKVQVKDGLKSLLAEYELKPCGEGRTQFQDRLGAEGRELITRLGSRKLDSGSSVRDAISEADKLYRKDADFRRSVNSLVDALRFFRDEEK